MSGGSGKKKKFKKRDEFTKLRARYFKLRHQALERGYDDVNYPRPYEVITNDETLDHNSLRRLQAGVGVERAYVQLHGKRGEYLKLRNRALDIGFGDEEHPRMHKPIPATERLGLEDLERLDRGIKDEASFISVYDVHQSFENKAAGLERNGEYVAKMKALRYGIVHEMFPIPEEGLEQ